MPRFLNRLVFLQQSAPSNPPSGHSALYVNSSDVPVIRSSAGVERTLQNQVLFPFSYTGTLVAGTGKSRLYNDTGRSLTIVAIRATVTTAPTGATVIVDVNKNGTTIFTTQGNRPTVAISGFTSGKVSNMDVTSLADGDYLTIDLDQIGSTVPGADLTVQVWAT